LFNFTNAPSAIAELRAFCLKHSALYINGIGPVLNRLFDIKFQ
jgi:hypothetical protein